MKPFREKTVGPARRAAAGFSRGPAGRPWALSEERRLRLPIPGRSGRPAGSAVHSSPSADRVRMTTGCKALAERCPCPLASAGAWSYSPLGLHGPGVVCARRSPARCRRPFSPPRPSGWRDRSRCSETRRGGDGGRARSGARRFSVAAARPTRLETRTKESAGCASRRVRRNPKAKRKRRSDPVPTSREEARAQGRPR